MLEFEYVTVFSYVIHSELTRNSDLFVWRAVTVTMSSQCDVCKQNFRKNEKKLNCARCAHVSHAKCMGGVDEDGKPQCKPCYSDENELEPTLKDVLRAVKQSELNLGRSLDLAHEKVDSVSVKLDSVCKDVNSLQLENIALKERVHDLETRVSDAEQYSRVNDVGIHGLPCLPGESVPAVLASLGRALGDSNLLTAQCVGVAHRTGPVTAANRGIIVRFLRKSDKSELMRPRKVKRG